MSEIESTLVTLMYDDLDILRRSKYSKKTRGNCRMRKNVVNSNRAGNVGIM